MGFFGTRKDSTKDQNLSTPSRSVSSPGQPQVSRSKAKSKISNLFSDEDITGGSDAVSAAGTPVTVEDKCLVPTITMDAFDPAAATRDRIVTATPASSVLQDDGRNFAAASPRQRALTRKASRQDGIMQRASSISRLSNRNSLKRSISIKIARSESRRQQFVHTGKENEEADLNPSLQKNALSSGVSKGQLDTFIAGLSLSRGPSSTGEQLSNLQRNSAVSDSTIQSDNIVNANVEKIGTFEYAEADEDYMVEEATGSDFGAGKEVILGEAQEIKLHMTADCNGIGDVTALAVTKNEESSTPPAEPSCPKGKKARKRPPPLNKIDNGTSITTSVSDAPKTTVFFADGGFATGGFKITVDGMVGMPPIATREDSDPQVDNAIPQSENLVIVRSLKEFRAGPTIGAGAAGRVYLADHIPSRKTMAIKVVNVYDKGTRHQLLKELQTLCTYVSRYLVRFYGAFYDGSGAMHIALEFMDHGCLNTFVQRVGAIPERVVQMIASDCLRGLRFLHRNRVLHRDFKTANILLSRRQCCAKLSDFGLARDMNQCASRVETFVGTVAYMSPERLHGSEYTFASDIWALGVSIVECLLGRYPFNRPRNYFDYIDATMTPDVWKGCEQAGLIISKEAKDFVTQCTHADPGKRLDANQLLEHGWLKGMKRDSELFGSWLDQCRIQSMRVAAASPHVRQR